MTDVLADDFGNTETGRRLARRLTRFVTIHDHPWFFRMKEANRDTGLTGYYGAETLKTGLVVACDVKGANGNYKRFAYFNSREDFLAHEAKYPDDQHHFYEVIGATTKAQRPYFDIDIPAENYVGDELEYITIAVIDGLKRHLSAHSSEARRQLEIDMIDYVVYETKYPIDPESGSPKKYSYHLIINGYYFEDAVTMRAFGQSIKHEFADQFDISLIGDCIDDIWYSTRQFRLAGSSKIDSGCVKEWLASSSGREPSAAEGFVTNVEGCSKIPSFNGGTEQ